MSLGSWVWIHEFGFMGSFYGWFALRWFYRYGFYRYGFYRYGFYVQ
ncbi:MAG: hypothetical protein MUF72_16740 [Elainella sp. Prado103]|nr:hypothetical protein [Elainella sp. Prado103]